ncbi:MAG: hypothetical protein V1851_01720 [Patescibacteria group bacterium]
MDKSKQILRKVIWDFLVSEHNFKVTTFNGCEYKFLAKETGLSDSLIAGKDTESYSIRIPFSEVMEISPY